MLPTDVVAEIKQLIKKYNLKVKTEIIKGALFMDPVYTWTDGAWRDNELIDWEWAVQYIDGFNYITIMARNNNILKEILADLGIN